MINRFVYPILNTAFRQHVTSTIIKNTQSSIRSPAVLGIFSARNNSSASSKPPSSIDGLNVAVNNHNHGDLKQTQSAASLPQQDILGEGVMLKDDSLPEDILPDKLYKRIDLEVLAYEPAVLDSYEWFILTAASHLGIEVSEVSTPRKSDKWRFPLLKSAHIHKKHRVHYEIRTYHKFITLKKLTGSTASTYLEYIQRNIPEGIGMKVSKLEVLPKPDYVTPPSPVKTSINNSPIS